MLKSLTCSRKKPRAVFTILNYHICVNVTAFILGGVLFRIYLVPSLLVTKPQIKTPGKYLIFLKTLLTDMTELYCSKI